MKKTMICALLALAVACCGTALFAQDSMSQAGGPPQGQRMQMSPDQRLQHMTKMLNLTDDQQQKIKPILENQASQMQALHQDTTMSRQDKMAKMMQIRQSSNDQIKAILTPDQQAKFAQMQDRQMEHMGHGGMGQGQPQQAPPPQ